MCGIAGILRYDGAEPADEQRVRAMCAAMVHRGPDGEGYHHDRRVSLGMRRLAIIDLATGNQPVYNETGGVCVVFNGEIYNFQELRARLQRLGHRFSTSGDTETIVHAYEQYGLDFVQQLNGIFGLALWDTARERLVLARDRFGVKPLYYAALPAGLAFSSELRPLLCSRLVARAIDHVALGQYLVYQYVPSPRSIIEGVRKLRPGHLLVVEGGRIAESRYWRWDLSRSEREPITSEEEAVERFREVFRRVVRMEMVSDVPLGVLLSGGLDSSSVALAMAETSPGRVRSFSIGFEEPSFDESRYARRVASWLGTQHIELTLDARTMLEIVGRLGELLDEPLGDASFVPTYLVSQLARRHVTVALGGDGGDEMLAGYSTLQAHRLAQYYERVPWPLHRVACAVAGRLPTSYRNISLDFKVKSFLRGVRQHPARRHHTWIGAFTPEGAREVLADARVRPSVAAIEEPMFVAWNGVEAADPLNRVLYTDTCMYLEGDILPKVDRASMACSLETRVPFLNHELATLLEQVPLQLKLRGLTRKYLLRRAFGRRLPPEIVARPKKGFGMPVSAWLCHELRPLAAELLGPAWLKRQGLFRVEVIDALLEEHWARRRDNRQRLWSLLAFQLWSRAWL